MSGSLWHRRGARSSNVTDRGVDTNASASEEGVMSQVSQRAPLFVAEVKTGSPWGWRSPYSWEFLMEVADRVGDWVAIHTDPRWGGSWNLLRRARAKTGKPILAKGIHANDD